MVSMQTTSTAVAVTLATVFVAGMFIVYRDMRRIEAAVDELQARLQATGWAQSYEDDETETADGDADDQQEASTILEQAGIAPVLEQAEEEPVEQAEEEPVVEAEEQPIVKAAVKRPRKRRAQTEIEPAPEAVEPAAEAL